MCFRWGKTVLTIVLICLMGVTKAQNIQGITGLLNIPSAQMQQDGTFMAGINYLPDIITPEPFNYKTANYFFNITFLPFLEVSYKMTLYRNNGRYNQQDRSIAIRGQFIRERHIIPSVVVGANDIYTQNSGSGNQYFGALYIVTTKHFEWNKNIFGSTIGYYSPFRLHYYQGVFGGLSFSPSFFNQLSLMTEYDSNHWNVGGSCLVFNHVHLVLFICDLKNIVGGITYKIYLGDH